MNKTLLVIVLLGMNASVYAGEAHVCGSSEHSPLSNHQKNLDDTTIFTCGGGVKGTIPELAKQGWKIVQITEEMANMSQANPAMSTAYFNMIIQKG